MCEMYNNKTYNHKNTETTSCDVGQLIPCFCLKNILNGLTTDLTVGVNVCAW